MSTFATRGILSICATFTIASILVGSTPNANKSSETLSAQAEAPHAESVTLSDVTRHIATSRSNTARIALDMVPLTVDMDAVWVVEPGEVNVTPKPPPPPPPPPPPAPVVEKPTPAAKETAKPTKKTEKKAPPAKAVPAGESQAIAYAMMADYGWNDEQFSCLVNLWTRESGWNHLAKNPSSGAYGIPQSLPGNKMASAGADWQTNPATQIKWGLGYIKGRYKTPCGGWDHFLRKNWY